jgi:glycosyltransferase involved in cell wall biosynthesis
MKILKAWQTREEWVPDNPNCQVVILVLNNLGAGGTERQVSQLASNWVRKGMNVRILTWTEDDKQDFFRLPDSVGRVHLGVNRGIRGLPWTVIRVMREIGRYHSCVVVGFGEAMNAVVWLACLLKGKKSHMAIRANPQLAIRNIGIFWRPLVKLAYRFGGIIFTQTKGAAKWVYEEFARDSVVIGNALRPLPAPTTHRERIILTIGSLRASKGHEIVIRAFADVALKFPDWRLVIIGDGPLRSSLDGLVDGLGVSSRVSLEGMRSDVDGWLSRASIFALASRSEGYPNVLIEAMGMGNAVISTRCSYGPEEIIKHGINGMLTPLDDIEAMADVMRRLITDDDLRASLGRNALVVRQSCSEDYIYQAWERALFNQV